MDASEDKTPHDTPFRASSQSEDSTQDIGALVENVILPELGRIWGDVSLTQTDAILEYNWGWVVQAERPRTPESNPNGKDLAVLVDRSKRQMLFLTREPMFIDICRFLASFGHDVKDEDLLPIGETFEDDE